MKKTITINIEKLSLFKIVEGVLAIIGILFIGLILYTFIYAVPVQRTQINSQISNINDEEYHLRQELNDNYQVYSTDAHAEDKIESLIGQFKGLGDEIKGLDINPNLNSKEESDLGKLLTAVNTDVNNANKYEEQAQQYWSQV